MAFSRPVQWLIEALNGGNSSVTVNANTAIKNAGIWYGVNKISGNVGTLGTDLLQVRDGYRDKAMNHPAYGLLKYKPNYYQTPITFKQALTYHAIIWGNGRAYIHREGNRTQLLPFMPDRTVTGLVDGAKWHATLLCQDSSVSNIDDLLCQMEEQPRRTIMLPDTDVLHIQGFGHGVCGMSLFDVAKYSLEASLGADKRTARQMAKGFAGKVMLEAPAGSPYFRDQEKANEFLQDFRKQHDTDGDGEQVGLLREGVTANAINMSNTEAQFVQSKLYQRQDAAMWLMLETILGDNSSVSYNSEEQKQLAYLKNALMPWLVRWEQELACKLLTTAEQQQGYYWKFNTAALLRPDFATTVDTLCKGIAHRLWNPNEARGKLDMNPYEGGDEYENPAITPGSPGTTPDTAAMAKRLQHMLGIEQKRINQFIERGDSLDHIDGWYESWVDKLGQVVEELGGEWQTAQNHCVRSLNYLRSRPNSFDLAGSEELIIEEIQNAKV